MSALDIHIIGTNEPGGTLVGRVEPPRPDLGPPAAPMSKADGLPIQLRPPRFASWPGSSSPTS